MEEGGRSDSRVMKEGGRSDSRVMKEGNGGLVG
jgi:hypothetical protein